MKPTLTNYIVFTRQGYDRLLFCVGGRDISYADAICFIDYNEAHKYANKLNKKLEEEKSNEPGSSG